MIVDKVAQRYRLNELIRCGGVRRIVQIADDNDRYPTAKDRMSVDLSRVADNSAGVGCRPSRLLGADK